MEQEAIICSILGQFVSYLDTKQILERSVHWEHKILNPSIRDMINYPSILYTFNTKSTFDKKLCSEICNLKLYFMGIPNIHD